MAISRSISLEKCPLTDKESARLDVEIGRLERVTGKFPNPVLSGAIVRLARGRGHEAALALRVSGHTIAAREHASRPLAAFEAAARKIARQLGAYKGRLRHEASFAREGARKRRSIDLGFATALPSPFRDVERFREEVMRRLPEIREGAARVAREDQRLKRLVPRLIEVEDLVDEAIAEALRSLPERPPRTETMEWLEPILERVGDSVAERFSDAGRAARTVRTGSDESERITTPVEFLDAIQIIERGEWPESAREIAAPRESGGAPTERVEFRRSVASAVRRLPRSWRKALALRYFDGMKPAAISKEQRVPVAAVEWRLRAALHHLHETVPADDRP